MRKDEVNPKNTPAGKKRYRAPKLVKHGNLRQLTMVKGGAACDGAGKPMTKASGANA